MPRGHANESAISRGAIALGLAVLALGMSCGYAPTPATGVQGCAPASGKQCPTDYYCAADLKCWRTGTGPNAGMAGAVGTASGGAGRTGTGGAGGIALAGSGGGTGTGQAGQVGSPGQAGSSGNGTGGTRPGSGGAAGTGAAAMGSGGTNPSVFHLQGTEVHQFGDFEVGTTTPPATWTITNNGGGPSPSLALKNTAPTQILTSANTCTTALAAGASCSIAVALHTDAPGEVPGGLTITAGDQTVTYSPVGTGKYRLTVTVAGTGTVKSTGAEGINCGAMCTTLFDRAVTLSALNVNGSGYYRSGWGGLCPTPTPTCVVKPDGPAKVTVTFSPITNNLVFVTSRSSFAASAGLAGFDAGCNAIATDAGINNAAGNDYVAFVSSSTQPITKRLPASAQGWVRMDGRAFTGTQTDLFKNNQVFNPILLSENGDKASSSFVWTGTDTDGSATTDTCLDWTSASYDLFATFGQNWGGPKNFTNESSLATQRCSQSAGLICMGTTRQAALRPTVTSGKRIWVSNSPYVVGAGQTPDAKCNSALPAGVTAAAALVSYTTKPASSLLEPTTNYVRVDGTLVGTGAQLAVRGSLESGVWQNASGAYPIERVSGAWIGSQTPSTAGTSAETCGDWKTSTQSGYIGYWSDVRNWWSGQSATCDSTDLRLICIQTAP